MFGHDPPISFRSTTAVRRPALPIAQAKFLPASPLPMMSKSKCSLSATISSQNLLFHSALENSGFAPLHHGVDEYASFVVVVVQFCAKRLDASAGSKKHLRGSEHPQLRR